MTAVPAVTAVLSVGVLFFTVYDTVDVLQKLGYWGARGWLFVIWVFPAIGVPAYWFCHLRAPFE